MDGWKEKQKIRKNRSEEDKLEAEHRKRGQRRMITDQLEHREKRQTAGTSGKRETEENREGNRLNSEDGNESEGRNRLNSKDRDQEGV